MSLMEGWEFNPELDLMLEREIAVPRELVWRAWTEPEHLKPWFCPKPWYVSECEIDLRPGGKFRTVMNGPAGERMDNTGCFLEVLPLERLVWTDAMGPSFRPNEKPFMTGFISLEATPTGTRCIAGALHANAATKDQHAAMGFQEGWGAALEQLVEYAKSMG